MIKQYSEKNNATRLKLAWLLLKDILANIPIRKGKSREANVLRIFKNKKHNNKSIRHYLNEIIRHQKEIKFINT